VIAAVVTVGSISISRHHAAPALPAAPGKDAQSAVLGNPENGIRVLKLTYRLIGQYRALHGGVRPADNLMLFGDVFRSPIHYGFRDAADARAAIDNPDNRFSDIPPIPSTHYLILPAVVGKRPDGTPVGGPKAAGTRDVLAYTDVYFHRNLTARPGGPTVPHPSGYYLVLWDDGSIDRVDSRGVLAIQSMADNAEAIRARYHVDTRTPIYSVRVAFRGQAGLPAGTATTALDTAHHP